jgi:DNA-binding transcriptional ArsR family regulator
VTDGATCERCGHLNAADQRFCSMCGAALAKTCRSCGHTKSTGVAVLRTLWIATRRRRARGGRAAGDLAWVSERAENLVSHHLRALRAAGLVSSLREGKMVMYSLTEAGRSLLQAVLDRTEAPA